MHPGTGSPVEVIAATTSPLRKRSVLTVSSARKISKNAPVSRLARAIAGTNQVARESGVHDDRQDGVCAAVEAELSRRIAGEAFKLTCDSQDR